MKRMSSSQSRKEKKNSDFVLVIGEDYKVRCPSCGKVRVMQRLDIGIMFNCKYCGKESRLVDMAQLSCFKEVGERMAVRIG